MHKLSINGEKPFGIDEYYEKDDLVKIDLPFVTDTIMNVFAEGVNGRMENIDGCQYYCFKMPDHDVDVIISFENNMAKKSSCSHSLFSGIFRRKK